MEYTHSTLIGPTHPPPPRAIRLHLAKHENVLLTPKSCVNWPYKVLRISFFLLISVSQNRAYTQNRGEGVEWVGF